MVSARNAIRAPDLEGLEKVVEEQYKVIDDREKAARTASARLEADLVRQLHGGSESMHKVKAPQNQSRERRRAILRKFTREVERKGALKIRGRQEQDQTVWFGLGMFGIVGWSMAIRAAGHRPGDLDRANWPSQYSWTLMLLIAGLLIGCANAWYWVRKGGYSK